MKKFLASVLCLTLVMSMAACSTAKEPEQTTEPTTTTTTTTAETTTEPAEKPTETTEPSATTSESKTEDTSASSADKKANPASQYVEEKVEKVKVSYVTGDGEEDEYREYRYPQLLIESSYADKVNKDVAKIVGKYTKASNESDDYLFTGTTYAAFLTKDVLSLVLVSYHEWDCNEYKVYNIDVTTGEKVDNARIAKIAGVSSIRKAAMDALQKYYNDREWVNLKNYKVVLEPGQKKDDQMKNVEKSFGEKYLNDKMQIGLTEDGKMFFISTVGSMGGADFYETVYDVNGYDLDAEANAFVPFDTGDDEDYDVEEDDWTDEGEDAEEA